MHVLRLAAIVSLPPMGITEVHYHVTEYQVCVCGEHAPRAIGRSAPPP